MTSMITRFFVDVAGELPERRAGALPQPRHRFMIRMLIVGYRYGIRFEDHFIIACSAP